MKKQPLKILLMLAMFILIPAVCILTACGGKKLQKLEIVISNDSAYSDDFSTSVTLEYGNCECISNLNINAVYSDGSKEDISGSENLTTSITYIPYDSLVDPISKDMLEFMQKVSNNTLDSGSWKVTFGYNGISHELNIFVELSTENPNYSLSIKNILTKETNSMAYGTKSQALEPSVKLGSSNIDASLCEIFILDKSEEYDSDKLPKDYFEEDKLIYLDHCSALNVGTYKVCARVQRNGNYDTGFSNFIDFEIKPAKIQLISDPSELQFSFTLATSSEKLEDVTFNEMFYELTAQQRVLPSVRFLACSDGDDTNNDVDSYEVDKLTNEFIFDTGYWIDVSPSTSEKTYNAGNYQLALKFVPGLDNADNFSISDTIGARLTFNKNEIDLPYVQVSDALGNTTSTYEENLKSDGNFLIVGTTYVNQILCYTTTFDRNIITEEVVKKENSADLYYYCTHRATGDAENDFKLTLTPYKNFKFVASSWYYTYSMDYRDFTIQSDGTATYSWRINKANFIDMYRTDSSPTLSVLPIQNANINSLLPTSYSTTPAYNTNGTVDLRIGGTYDSTYFDNFDVVLTLTNPTVGTLTLGKDKLHYTFTPANKTEYIDSINVNLNITLNSSALYSLSFSTENDIAFNGTLNVDLDPIDPLLDLTIAHKFYVYSEFNLFEISSNEQVTKFGDIFLPTVCGTWTVEKYVNSTWESVDMTDATELVYSTEDNLQQKYRCSFTPNSNYPYVINYDNVEFYLAIN